MFVGKILCKKKNKTDASERNSSSERAHFKKCVVPVTIQDTVFWIEKKWQSWRSVVSDGAKTFFKLFSLRGGGHYLPCGFRLSSFPFAISKSSARDGVHILYIFCFGGFLNFSLRKNTAFH